MGTIPTERSFVETFEGYDDPVALLEDYRRVQAAMEDHPEMGSRRIASEVELPRSRIRTWVDNDSAPKPVQALHTAIDNGWIVDETATDRLAVLAGLVGWIDAGGSIQVTRFKPRFVVDREPTKPRLEELTTEFGVEIEAVGDDRSEFRVASDSALFGRVLAAAGAPTGSASDAHEVPTWIQEGSVPVRRAFLETLLLNRGVLQGRERNVLVLYAGARSEQFVEQVAAMLTEQTGIETYSFDGEYLRFDLEATELILDEFEGVRKAVQSQSN